MEPIDANVGAENSSFFDYLMDFLTQYWPAFLTVISIILGIIIFILFLYKTTPSKLNKRSINDVKINQRNKKYISDVYVEVDGSETLLRHFSSKKMRKIPLYELKSFFKSYYGQICLTVLEKRKYFLTKKYCLSILPQVLGLIEKTRDEIANIKFENEKTYLSANFYWAKNLLSDISNKLQIYDERLVVIKGRAGSGKTNLVSNFCFNRLYKYKIPFIFFDAKDLIGDIDDLIVSKICGVKNNEKYSTHLQIWKYLRKLLKQDIFIIIEGINEIHSEETLRALFSFIRTSIGNNEPYKFVVSVRSEYFDIKYRTIIEEVCDSYKEIELKDISKNNYLKEQFLLQYRKHFNFNGIISENVKNIICESPLLIRMFFEIYKDSNNKVAEISKAKIFNEYIDKIYKIEPEVKNILSYIVKSMVDNNRFDSVDYDELLKVFSNDALEKLINESILLFKTIKTDDLSIITNYDHIINITFDELRDYLLFNYLLESSEDDKKVLLKINEYYKANSPIAEGLIKNAYIHYRYASNEKILSVILRSFKLYNWHDRNDAFISLMLSNNDNLFDCEKKYVSSISNGIISRQLINELVLNEINDIIPGIQLLKEGIECGFIKSSSMDKKEYDFFLHKIDKSKKSELYSLLLEMSKNCKELYLENSENEYYHFQNKYNDYFFLNIKRSYLSFLLYFRPKIFTYEHLIVKRIYQYFYLGSFSIRRYYARFYKKEFDSLDDFIISIFKVKYDDGLRIKTDSFWFKDERIASGNSIIHFITDNSVKKAIYKAIAKVEWDYDN